MTDDSDDASNSCPSGSSFLSKLLILYYVETNTDHRSDSDRLLSATARALFCQDIVEVIFGNLSLDMNTVIFDILSYKDSRRDYLRVDAQRENRRTLAAAARVSKSFSEVALSVLWAKMDGFDRLFSVLPQYTSTCLVWEDSLTGKSTDEDWARLEKYAALVREASLVPRMDFEKTFWQVILHRYHSAARFLPRLQAIGPLNVIPGNTEIFNHPQVLSCTLRHLYVLLDVLGWHQDDYDGPALGSALQQIAAAIPSLSSLTVSAHSVNTDFSVVSWEMASFTSIRNLEITSPLAADNAILATIGQFEHLQALSVRITEDCAHLQGCFQALTLLNVGGSAAHIQSLLAATSPPFLHSLSILFYDSPSTPLLMQCLSSLSSYVPSTLSVLELKSFLIFHPEIPSVMDAIRPTLAFHMLTHFAFKLRPLPSLSDDDIVAMISAWPALTALRVEHSFELSRTPEPIRPTARILPFVATHCPHLHTLGLPEIDLAVTPTLDALPSALGRHPLRILDVEPCRCTDRDVCARAAAAIDRLFPFLELPCLYGEGCEELGEVGWTAVVKNLKAMGASRRPGNTDIGT